MYPYSNAGPSEATIWTLAIHLLLLAVGSIPILLLLRQSKRKAEPSQLWLLGLAFVTVTVIVIIWAQLAESHELPFLLGFLIYFYVVIITTFVIVSVRVYRKLGRTPVATVLLSVVGLLLLIGLLLPAVPSAREAARRMACGNNLKQLSLSLILFGNQHKVLPQPIGNTESGQSISWRVQVLPFLEHSELFSEYDQTQAYDSEKNLALQFAPKAPSIYVCPSDFRPDKNGLQGKPQPVYSAYTIPIGLGAASEKMGLPYDEFVSAQGSQFLILEACGQNIIWSEPREVELSEDSLGINLPGYRPGESRAILSSRHHAGAQAARVDGSVTFLSDKIDPVVLRQLCEAKP